MQEIQYEFVDIDSDENFQSLGNCLGGILKNNTLFFDNNIAKGELIKSSPDTGLWIRKWKLTVLQKLILHKVPPPWAEERKLILVYFLDPSIFLIKNKRKNIPVSSAANNMFLTNKTPIDFSVIPKHPFYVLDIAFTESWLRGQIIDADPASKNALNEYINTESLLMEACSKEEYKILRELEISMVANNQDILFIRSRVYNLIVIFFNKLITRKDRGLITSTIHYDQLMQAEMLMMQSIKKPPKIEMLARQLNLSVSSLLRQFKLLFGKGVYEYYLERKMELAKKMILENKVSVKETAEILGYNQASPFIEAFTKQHGFSPGSLKLESENQLFFK
jgi:AraC-like DNA-binding protein